MHPVVCRDVQMLALSNSFAGHEFLEDKASQVCSFPKQQYVRLFNITLARVQCNRTTGGQKGALGFGENGLDVFQFVCASSRADIPIR